MIKLFSNNNLWNIPNWLFHIIIILAAILTGIVLKVFFVRLTKYYRSKSSFSFVRSSVIHLGRPIGVFLPLVFLSITRSLIVLPPGLLVVYVKIIEIGLI